MAAMASVETIKLDPKSAEYRDIAQKFNSKFIVNLKKCELLSIERVRNEALEQRFRDKKKEYEDAYGQVKVVQGWHGTKEDNIASILKNNFDVSANAGRRHRFGPGVSFSSLSSYAYNYCDKNTPEACMLLADVLVSNVVEVAEKKDRRKMLRAPPCLPGSSLRYDTTAKNKERMDVFVKADRDAFMPTHVVRFKRGATPAQAPPRAPAFAQARAPAFAPARNLQR
ncbi:protein mono-ADP-ribosyltransferase TIPARP-like, partial [Thrips palmi]|uniref:Poly [ADP-ribose] polymerase n=1 Tax=Thrips palmi TaxID=161013 RepID=A0A6P8YN48_THRPL